MGIIASAFSMATVAGPLLGGIVYAKSGYYAVFYMAFALIALDIALRLSFIEKKVAKRWLTPDELPMASSIGMTRDPTNSNKHETQDLAAAEEVTSQGAEDQVSRSRLRKRLPPVVTLLGSRRLLAASWGTLVVAALMTAFDSTLTLYVKRIFDWNSLGSGLLFLALLLPSSAGPIVGMMLSPASIFRN